MRTPEENGRRGTLPEWLRREIAHPATEGGRNEQMIRIAPALIRLGYSSVELHCLFDQMYGGEITSKEISSVLRSASRYAKRPLAKLEFNSKREAQLRHLKYQAQRDLKMILTKYHWPASDIVQAIAEAPPVTQTKTFLRALFDLNDVIWIGMEWHSGKHHHRTRFRPVGNWLASKQFSGEFCSHCTFKPGTFSRSNDAVERRKFFVVESDTLGRNDIGAVFRWLEANGLRLRAIVDSGKRSLHGWFDYPGNRHLDEWLAMLGGLKCDPATTRPSQPVRLPGIVRGSTKKLQRLLYIQ